MFDSHTGQNLKETFVTGLEYFSMEKKLMGITLDNASNNAVFICLLTNWAIEKRISFDKNDNHFRYFAHVINLSVQAGSRTIYIKSDIIMRSRVLNY
ncbi:zinc finger BED domain-containing protein RICESLEEPER 2-like [Rhizophagus irregularis DAOM 181602=DAOM 197198]|nr:zinc finger BED domain-containing protein RICESLEEPER 2-like [Rhizophagus irregularis DAOM 181602=DAOM 197198]